MRPVTVEFTVTADLNERSEVSCVWHCNECSTDMTAREVRAHLIGHAHEDIGVPS